MSGSADIAYDCATCGAAAGVADLEHVPRCRACAAAPTAAKPPAGRRKAAPAPGHDADATPITDVGAPAGRRARNSAAQAASAASSAPAPAGPPPASATAAASAGPSQARARARARAAAEASAAAADAAAATAAALASGEVLAAVASLGVGRGSRRGAATAADDAEPVAPEPSDYAPAVAPAAPRGAPTPSRAEWLAAADAREGWLERLDPAEPEAAAVVARFLRSAGRALRLGVRKRADVGMPLDTIVVAIYRARNPAAELLHEQCRARLAREAGAAEAPALTLYHGTDRAAAGAIVRGGFDASRSGTHGEALGRGIYLSTTASYSMHYAKPDVVGGRAMLVCSALVGVVGRHSAHSGNIYCVRREMQALPLYVIWS